MSNTNTEKVVFSVASAARQPRNTTQFGNAERLVSKYGNNIRYCHAWKKWLIWDGRCWRPDDKERICKLAKNTVTSIYGEIKRAETEEERRQLFDHARRSESRYETDAMVSLAQSDVPVTPAELDRDPWLFNCQNGTIDLKTGTLRQHNQAELLSKLSPVKFDPSADCPNWLRFLSRIFAGDDNLVSFLQQALGYALTGIVTEKALFTFIGDGDNGKTTLLEAIRHIMGDYAGTIEISHLMHDASTSDQQRTIADLHGKRFITASEAEEGQRLNESKIKQITGMGRLTGRRLYGNAFEFDPLFKLFIDANHKPIIRGNDQAIWRRIRLVPFNVSIPKAEQDRDLLSKLKTEAPGILAWAVKGCMEWRQRRHLISPLAVESAVESYRQEMDIVAEFLSDCCTEDSAAEEPASKLYAAFQKWCEERRESPVTSTAFGRRLEEKGLSSVRSSSERKRKGLRLNGAVHQADLGVAA